VTSDGYHEGVLPQWAVKRNLETNRRATELPTRSCPSLVTRHPSPNPLPRCDTFERSLSLLRDLLLFRDVVHNLGRVAVGIMRVA
jgi:hypothetical protein